MNKILLFFILLTSIFVYSNPEENNGNVLGDIDNELILIVKPPIDGCSGNATFNASYDPTNCCWTFQNTTTNDCMQWYCIWDFGDGSPTVSTAQGVTTVCHQFPGPGVYTVILQFNSSACHGGSGGICTGSQNVSIPQLNLASVESNYNGYNISCEGEDDGWINMSAVTNYTYEWPVSSNSPWTTSQFGPNVSNLSAGTYTVLATGANGCTGTMIITLNEPNLSGSAILTNPTCTGYSDGSIDFTPVGGFSPFQYSWDNGTSLQDPFGLMASAYIVVLTDSYGCTDTFDYTLSEPTSIVSTYMSSNYNGYNVSCSGYDDAYIDLTTSGSVPPYSFQWSSGQTTEDINNLSFGLYNLTITDDNLCTKLETIVINEPSPLVSSISVSSNYNGYDISCYGFNDGSINLSVSGSVPTYLYSWNNGPTTEDISSLTIGWYNVGITDINGCTLSDSIVLTQPLPLLSTINSTTNFNGYDISCFGYNDGNIDLGVYGSVPPYNYSWNSGDITQDLNNVTSGYFSVNILDNNNCHLFKDIVLNEPLPFSSTDSVSNYNGVNISCFNFSDGTIDFELIGSVPPYSYSWNNNVTSQDLNNISSGLYSVNVVDDNGCLYSDSFNLFQPSSINSFANTSNACYGDSNGFVQISVVGGTPFYQYNWNGYNPNTLSSGTYFYSITDINNCLFSDSVVISQPSIPLSVVENITNVNCYGGINGSILLNISGSTPPYYTSWINNINPSILYADTYYYQIIDFNGCGYSDSVIVTEPLAYNVIQNTNDVSCFGLSDGSVSLNIYGNNPPYNINWNGVDTNNLSAGTYAFVITDQNNCIYSGLTTINEPNPIDVIYSINNPSCFNTNDGNVSLIISGGISPYNTDWFGQNPNQLTVGSYQFVVIDSNSCADTNNVILSSISNISISESVYDVSCKGFCDGEVDLIINNGVPPYQINWFGNDPDSLCVGPFSYEIIDSLGCLFTNNGIINSPDSLDLTLSVLNNQILMADVVGGIPPYSYNWFTVSAQISTLQSINPTNAGTYYCVVFDQNHCQSDTVKILYSELGIDYYELSEILIYPNPTDGVLNLYFESLKNQDILLQITNTLGQSIIEKNLSGIQGDYSYIFDLSTFSKGIYYLIIKTEDSEINYKIIHK